MHEYKKLVVWQKSIDLAVRVYELTEQFPSDERYGLVSQMRRAAISVPSNIAEGSLRGSGKEFKRFLTIAFGSGGELETQLHIAKKLPQTADFDYHEVDNLLNEVMRMLNAMISKDILSSNLDSSI